MNPCPCGFFADPAQMVKLMLRYGLTPALAQG